MTTIQESAQDQLFRTARTYSSWQDKFIDDELLHKIYDLTKYGPTSANCSPARFHFVRSPEAKQKLKPCLAAGNVEKTLAAPITVIVAEDREFYEKLPKLYPFTDARAWFVGNDDLIQSTAFRNTSLQGGYFILALRALGLDAGPMSGFDNAKLDETFFAGTALRSNFLINVGYGDKTGQHSRAPRLEFDEACKIL